MDLLQASDRPAAGSGSSSGRNRAGSGTTGETSGSGTASEERLDYPFTILEVTESAGPAPVVAADEAETDPQS